MELSYQGLTHSDVDTSSLVWQVANAAHDLKLQSKLTKRDDVQPKLIADLQIGCQKFKSSSLATFNKKIQDLKAENPIDGEVNDISTSSFQIEITISINERTST